MSSLLLDYPQLLSRAAISYGGASADDFCTALGQDLSPEGRRKYKPLFQGLSTASGYNTGSLFTGIPACATGFDALTNAHTEAFGSGIGLTELSVEGSAQDDTLPARLAGRLEAENLRLWRGILASGIRAALPFIPADSLADFLRDATPQDWSAPRGIRGAAVDEIDMVVLRACNALVANTTKRLHRPRLPGGSVESQAARCLDNGYLIRCYRRTIRQGYETMLLHAGVVHAQGEQYLSRASFRAWLRRQRAQRQWMSRTIIRDRLGEIKDRSLLDVSPSNHAKRSRLLAVLAGIDTLALEAGLACAMLTLTLPPQWHPAPSHGKQAWAGASHNPATGASALISDWSAYLRDLANVGVSICGIRVVEAHKDGCPHVHCLVYYQPEDEMAIVTRLANAYSVPSVRLRSCVVAPSGALVTRKGVRYDVMEEHYDATAKAVRPGGGNSHRIEIARVNRAISSAVSYVAKYVTKALQADALPDDDDEAEKNMALLAAGHASHWSYRRFALFGIRGKLSAWDELRRVHNPPQDAMAGALWLCAKDGDFAGYLRLVGGLAAVGVPKNDVTISLSRLPRKTIFGDMSHSITGVKVFCGAALVLDAITRSPGRFELIDATHYLSEVEFEDVALGVGIEIYTSGDPPF